MLLNILTFSYLIIFVCVAIWFSIKDTLPEEKDNEK